MVGIQCRKSIAEVLDILKYTNKEDVDKISPEFIKFLKENVDKEYIPKLDHTKRIKDMQLNQETIGLLSVIHAKFWCTQEQRVLLDKKLKENEEIYQEVLRKNRL